MRHSPLHQRALRSSAGIEVHLKIKQLKEINAVNKSRLNPNETSFLRSLSNLFFSEFCDDYTMSCNKIFFLKHCCILQKTLGGS